MIWDKTSDGLGHGSFIVIFWSGEQDKKVLNLGHINVMISGVETKLHYNLTLLLFFCYNCIKFKEMT